MLRRSGVTIYSGFSARYSLYYRLLTKYSLLFSQFVNLNPLGPIFGYRRRLPQVGLPIRQPTVQTEAIGLELASRVSRSCYLRTRVMYAG
jgi:hypothetical protein